MNRHNFKPRQITATASTDKHREIASLGAFTLWKGLHVHDASEHCASDSASSVTQPVGSSSMPNSRWPKRNTSMVTSQGGSCPHPQPVPQTTFTSLGNSSTLSPIPTKSLEESNEGNHTICRIGGCVLLCLHLLRVRSGASNYDGINLECSQ